MRAGWRETAPGHFTLYRDTRPVAWVASVRNDRGPHDPVRNPYVGWTFGLHAETAAEQAAHEAARQFTRKGDALRGAERRLREMVSPNRYCWNRLHGEPCRLPCDHCARACRPEDWEDSPLNRARTAEWNVRRVGRRPRC